MLIVTFLTASEGITTTAAEGTPLSQEEEETPSTD